MAIARPFRSQTTPSPSSRIERAHAERLPRRKSILLDLEPIRTRRRLFGRGRDIGLYKAGRGYTLELDRHRIRRI
jgi:hypothetical protein